MALVQDAPSGRVDIESLRRWVGRQETREDVITAMPATLLAATLDRELAVRPGDELPLAWHWLYFLPVALMREVGVDGHPDYSASAAP